LWATKAQSAPANFALLRCAEIIDRAAPRMSTLPAGYRFEKLAADYVLLARQGEVVSRFYTPDDPNAGLIATFHALGYAHGRLALQRELQAPLARLLHEARALAAHGEQPELGTAIQLVQRAIDAVQL
jgi:hypothetical protein